MQPPLSCYPLFVSPGVTEPYVIFYFGIDLNLEQKLELSITLLCISYQQLRRKQRKEWSKIRHREMKQKLSKENNSPWLLSLTVVDRRDINSGMEYV